MHLYHHKIFEPADNIINRLFLAGGGGRDEWIDFGIFIISSRSVLTNHTSPNRRIKKNDKKIQQQNLIPQTSLSQSTLPTTPVL